MRIVDSARLWFAEGNSDKVYEVDLVEVATNQFVVNFRYGRRGSALRDGTKTANPVALAKARTIFETLVQEKRKGGYRDGNATSTPTALAGDPYRTAPAATAVTPEVQHLIRRMSQGRRRQPTIPYDVRRAETLGHTAAEPVLLELLRGCAATDTAFAAQLIAALAHCGTASALNSLATYVASKQLGTLARCASMMIAQRSGGGTETYDRCVAPLLTPAVQGLLNNADSNGLVAAATNAMSRDVTLGLYLSGHAAARAAVFAVVRTAAQRDQHLVHVLYKLAGLQRDGEMFALCARHIDDQRTTMDNRLAQKYFRRRTVRTLRRLGNAQSRDFAPMACGMLLAYRDSDAQPVRAGMFDKTWPAFARYHALNYLLHDNKDDLFRGAHGTSAWYHGVDGLSWVELNDAAFPALWTQRPDLLWRLLRNGQLHAAITFAAITLRKNAGFLASITDDEFADTMADGHRTAQKFAFEFASERAMTLTLAAGAAASKHAPAHDWVVSWAVQHPSDVAASGAWLALLITGNAEALGATAKRIADSHGLTVDVQRETTLRALASLLALQPPSDGGDELVLLKNRVARACALLRQLVPQQLLQLAVPMLEALIAHPLATLGELAGDAMLNHAHRAALPATLIEALLASPHASVRLLGGRVVATTPVDVAKDNPAALIAFALSINAELRQGTRQLIGAVANVYPDIGRAIATELIAALQKAHATGVPAHLVSLLGQELRGCLPTVPAATVLKLIGALSPHARQAGGLLLAKLSADELELDALAKLAHHEIAAIRQSAWQLASAALPRYRLAPIALARLLDGEWEDARTFALGLLETFEATYGLDALGVDAIVTVCDSIRPTVEAAGKRLILRHCNAANAPAYLHKLSQHPSVSVQLLVSGLLQQHAAGKVDMLRVLLPYFTTVLSQVNRGKVAKLRVVEFLRAEAQRSNEAATLLAPVLDRQSATMAVTQRAPLIATMVEVHDRYPEVTLPIVVTPVAPHRSNGGDHGV